MSVRVAGIQPGYLPWLGYFDQMAQVDLFLVADEMPFSSTGWTHRNRVLGPNGTAWLRLPTRARGGQRIDEVAIEASEPWHRRHMRTLRQSYARSPWAADEVDALARALDPAATSLVDVASPSLLHLAGRFGITTPIVFSSALGLEARYRAEHPSGPGPTHRIVSFLEALGADQLLEGASGASYLDVELCRRHGISVAFHDYDHPSYPQQRSPGAFVSHLSAVDLLLSVGAADARRVLARGRSR